MKGHPTVKPPCFGEALDGVESLEDIRDECNECPWLEQCLEKAILKLESEEGNNALKRCK